MTGPTTMPTPPQGPSGSSWALAAGDVLAPGRGVIRRVGGGGAHEAFLVETAGSLRRAVAKLPRPHLAGDPHCLLGLKREAHALRQLAHPGVPEHLDTVVSGPHPHLLLSYVPGPDLAHLLAARHPLSPSLVASLGCSVARVLDHIAGAGWVHLDVKPSNILLNASPRLLDFELARPADEAARMTRPSGTWAYMAPEQRATGTTDAPAIGPPADVFGLAVTLGEALAGRPLPPSARRPGAGRGRLGALLDEGLAAAPGERPTAAELADGFAELAEPLAEVAA
jgi:serine/threonine protein kinase